MFCHSSPLLSQAYSAVHTSLIWAHRLLALSETFTGASSAAAEATMPIARSREGENVINCWWAIANIIQIVDITADLMVSSKRDLYGPTKSDVILCHLGSEVIWSEPKTPYLDIQQNHSAGAFTPGGSVNVWARSGLTQLSGVLGRQSSLKSL